MRNKLHKLMALVVVNLFTMSAWAQASYNFSYTEGVQVAEGGDYFLYNIGAKAFLTDGMDWGTHATADHAGRVVTLAKVSEEPVAFSIFTASCTTQDKAGYMTLNGYLDTGTNDANWAFTPVELDGYTNAYTIKHSDTQFLIYNTDKRVAVGNSSSNDYSYWLLVPRKAREEVGDYTFLLQNSDFNRPWERVAWTVEGGDSKENGFTNKAGAGDTDENTCGEIWHKQFNMYQKVSGASLVPNGRYVLYCQGFFNDTDEPAYLYANGEKSAFKKLNANGEGTETNMSSASASFTQGYYVNSVEVLVADNTLKVGVENVNAGNWVIFDNFVLTYLGLSGFEIPDYEDALKAAKEAATKTDKMEATVMPALNAAIATYGEVDVDDQEALGEAIIALVAATNNVNASIAAYASAGKYFPKMAAALEGTNVYTKEAYDANYAKWLAEYENNTLATETAAKLTENSAYSSGHKTANYLDDILLSVWSIGGEQAKDYDKGFYVNTWSVEGNNDGSEFFAPFFEYWTGDDKSLGANTIQAKMTGLKAETLYSFTIRARVRNTNDQTKVAEGITMKVGEGTPVDISAGAQFSTTQFYIGNFTAEGKTDAEGTLTVTITVAENSNISWLSFYNAKYTEGEDLSGYIADYEFVLNNAKAALEKGMAPNLRGDLQAAVDKYGAVDKSDKAALIAAKAALDEAMAPVAASVAAFAGTDLSAWKTTGNNGTFEVNTWSTEGDSDGSNMKTPFAQNWQGKEKGALGDVTMSYTIEGQKAGYYKVTALVRSLNEAGGTTPEGTFIFANEAIERAYTGEACKNGVYDNPVVYGYVGEDGKLTLGVKVIRANVNWVSWKNFTVEYVGAELTSEMAANLTEEAPEFTYNLEMKAALESAISALSTLSNDSYTAAGKVIEEAYNALDLNMAELDAAIAKAEEKAAQYTLGFAVGEYAPYTNISGLAPIAAAKEVRATAASQAEVDKAAADLNAAVETAVWTANTVEMDAVYNGNFAVVTEGADYPLGWTRNSGHGEMLTDVTGCDNGTAYYSWPGSLVYGSTGAYLMPLKANTVYKLTFKYRSHEDGSNQSVTVSVLNGEDGLKEHVCAANPSKTEWVSAEVKVTTGAAGNYVLTLANSGNTWMTDVSLVKVDDQGTGIEHSELNTQHSAVIYDLSGRRVEKAVKGLYIVNGKKVVK